MNVGSLFSGIGGFDGAVASTVARLPELERRIRRVELQRDLLQEAAVAAAEHLRPLGEYGGASEVVVKLDSALEAVSR